MNLDTSETSADTSENPGYRQIKEKGVPDRNIYIDINGRNDQYEKLINRLKPDNMIYVGSLTYLGKDYEEIAAQWNLITLDKQADVAVLDTPLLDTCTDVSSIDRDYISKLAAQLLMFVDKNDKTLPV